MQTYINRIENESSGHNSLDEIFPLEKPVLNEEETIATKEFNTSTVHLNLNIVNPLKKNDIKKKEEGNAMLMNKDVNIFK